jgi:Fe-S-cluster containining protein
MESDRQTDCDELFVCTLCGECCKGFGGTYLTEADMAAIARHLGISVRRMIDTYTCLSGGRRMIAQAETGYCIFWDKVCTIHPVKPRMCRQWPYLRSILVDVANWRTMAASCPGMKADAGDASIIACVKKALGC